MAKSLADKRDLRILYYLDLNARTPFSSIARKLKLSPDAVQYRVSQMQKNGVIRGFYTVIDPSALGFLSCRFFLKFKRTTPKIEKQIIDYFVESPYYWWIGSIDGFRDLGVACWLQSTDEFAEKKKELQKKFGANLEITQESIYSAFYQFSCAYLAGKEEDEEKTITLCKGSKLEIDKLDWQILKLIANNARLSSLEIAKKANVTPATVLNRLKKLQNLGVIRRFRPMIDLEKLHYYWYKIEFMLNDYSVKKDMLEFFRRHPNIVYAYEAIGGADLEVELEVESYEHFRSILDEIKEQFGESIENYQHLLWYKEHKVTYLPHRG
ncbi:MAG: winged helix-turn-helix transcriptional regulator [Candidatus Micrarchaeota archaeon]